MSRLLSSVVFLCLSLLWTINCENGVHLEVDYDTGKYHGSKESGDLRYTPGNNFALNCKKGARFVLKGFPQLRATRWEDYLEEDKRLRSPIDILRPLCKFSDPSDLSACRFVRNGVAPSVEGREEDPCTIYYDAKLLQAEETNGEGEVQLKVLNKSDQRVGIEIFVIHFNKARITHTTPVTDDPVTDDPGVLDDCPEPEQTVESVESAQSVDIAQIVESAKSVNAEEGVTFKVKYEVGTFPNSQKRCCLWDKWNFKPDRKTEGERRVKDIQYLEFTCGPSKPVQLNCENEMCFSIAAVTADGNSGTIVAYVLKHTNKERYHLVKPKKKMPKRHFCTLLVSPESYKVGIPKLFYKRHINILRIGSEEKRGFRVFRKSFKAVV